MTAGDWSTLASVATALGTLILAIATFSAIRSANASARTAERALLAGLRPVIAPSRRDDPELKVNYGDRKWVKIPGGGGLAEVGGGDGSMGSADPVYLAANLRNVGTGMAVLHGWVFYPGWHRAPEHAPLEQFRRLNRDLYVPPGDVGFWQAAFRDEEDPQYDEARMIAANVDTWSVELLYGDTEGGQRAIARMSMFPVEGDAPRWIASVSRYWNIDRPDPR
jgi:hypothetical protein